MQLSEFTVSLIYLGLPGIIAVYFVEKLTGVKPTTTITYVLSIFVLSFLSFLLIVFFDSSLTFFFTKKITTTIINIDILFAKNSNLSILQLFSAICASLPLSYMLAYAYNQKWINRLGQWIHVTKRYGDEDVWHFFHNALYINGNEWVVIRDYKANLVYYASILAWSETEKDRELILSNVSVYTNTSDYLYDSDTIYICRAKDDLLIELNSSVKQISKGDEQNEDSKQPD